MLPKRYHASLVRDFILDLLFPINCLRCRTEGSWLCPDCLAAIARKNGSACPVCHQLNENGQVCAACRDQTALDGLWVVCEYDDPAVQELIKKFKYHLVKDIGKSLGRILASFLQERLSAKTKLSCFRGYNVTWENHSEAGSGIPTDRSVLIPVPLHPRRERWRGFNQSLLLAQYAASALAMEMNSRQLRRAAYSRPQAQLSRTERLENLKDSFIWTGANAVPDSIILIDDVAATGTTLDECARTLKAAGARMVWGLVVARG